MPTTYLDEEDHIIRQVPSSRQVLDPETRELLGVSHNAFTLKEGEEYLSVAWLEYFDEDYPERLQRAVNQIRAQRSDRQSTVYWICQVSEVRRAMNGHKFRAISEPIGDYKCHAALRRWPSDDPLLELLASEAVAECVFSRDIPKLEP